MAQKITVEVPDEVATMAGELGVIDPGNPMVNEGEVMAQEQAAAEQAAMPPVDPEQAAAVADFASGTAEGVADPFNQAVLETSAELETSLMERSKKTAEERGLLGGVLDTIDSVGVGVMSGGFNTWNTFGDLIGAPPAPQSGRWGIENETVAAKRELERRGGANGFVIGAAEFVTGLLGVGKVMDAVKVTQWAAKGGIVGRGAFELGKGGVAAGLAFDPHAARLSDLVESVPALRNPVTEFLQSNPEDTAAMGRLKNALEGAGLDLAVASVFGAALRVYRGANRVTVLKGEGADTAEAAAELATAEADLAREVAKAKGEGAAQGTPTVGGSPAKLPGAPNVIDQKLAADDAANAAGVEQRVLDNAAGLGPGRNQTAAEIERGMPKQGLPSEGNLLTKENTTAKPKPGAAGASTIAKEIEAPPPKPANEGTLGDAIADTAKSMGIKVKKAPKKAANTNTADIPVPERPKIETNGIKYSVIPQSQMGAVGRAYGIDSSRWLGAANHNTGEIYISDAVLQMPPAKQQQIIMHETGHVLERQMVQRLTGKEGRFTSLPKVIRDEMRLASNELRPESWNELRRLMDRAKVSPEAGKKAKGKRDYLDSPGELFADAFSIWKTNRAKFAEIAPETTKLFDQHLQPWMAHDFTTHAGDVNDIATSVAAREVAPPSPPSLKPAGGPKKVYANRDKAQATVDQYQPEAIVSLDDAAALAKSYEADAAAIATHGSKQAAMAAGHRFAKTANLPYQKLRTSEDLQEFMTQTANQFKETLDNLKGEAVLSDPRVARLIQERVDLFNEDPSLVMGQLQAAGRGANQMVANMEAAFAIANKAAADLTQLVRNNKAGNYAEFKGDANAAESAVAARIALYVEAIGSAQAMRAAAGRSLRRLRGDFIVDEATLNRIRTLQPEDAAAIIENAGGDMKLLSKLATRGFWDRFVRGVGSLFANNLLWGWPTHVVNTVSNTFQMATSPAIRAVGSFGLREGGQDIRIAALREYRYMVSALNDARISAVQAYMRGDGILDPRGNEFFRDAHSGQQNFGSAGSLTNSIGFTQMATVGDVLGNTFKAIGFVLGQPNRLLGTSDEFFKQTSYRGSVMAKASVEADQLGLAGQSYHDYIARELEKAFDADGKAVNAEALLDAQTRTFSQPLLPGTAGKYVAQGVSQFPVLRFVLPFVRTPVNLFRIGVKWLPGINMLQKEYREMMSGALGPKRQADAMGQMGMGVLIASSGVMLAKEGLITGGGPTNPMHRRALSDTGWKPYSIRLSNPDGSFTYVPVNRFDPTGMILSLIGDAAQAMNSADATDAQIDQIVTPMLLAMAKTFANRTYLQSINDAIDAIGDPDQSMERWAGRTLSSAVPASSLLRNANPDPYLRDAKGIMDTVLAGIPGFSDDVPYRRDVFGEPIHRTSGLVFTDSSADVAEAEQQRLLTNYGQGLTPLVAVEKGGIDLRKFKLASTGSTAFDRYQELTAKPKGAKKTLKEALGDLILSPQYAGLVDAGDAKGSKLHALQQVRDRYRQAAYKQLLNENPDLASATGMQQQAMREAGRKKANASALEQLNAVNASVGAN